ncbi:MAG: DUF421 domain-containing protein [Rickettsiales bacterium]|jgi:uncharacterized membrane protein YcaP (DUF421 family)|nr:DUF421 domain-containing protein [Rickettsiales bacterium]
MQEILSYYGTRVVELLSAFLVILIFVKIFGMNYQLKQMTALDLIINFILGAILGGFITNDRLSTFNFFIIMSIYIAMVYVVTFVTKKTGWGQRLLIGSPKIIIQDGKVDEEMINRLNLSAHEIAAALRRQKIHSLTEVKMAQIEPGGDLTVVKKGDQNYSIVLMDNGIVDEQALRDIKKNDAWLKKKLKEKKIKNADDVFIAQWHNGRLHIVRKS